MCPIPILCNSAAVCGFTAAGQAFHPATSWWTGLTFPRRLWDHKAREQEGCPGGQASGFQFAHTIRGQSSHQVHQVLQSIFGFVLFGLLQSGGTDKLLTIYLFINEHLLKGKTSHNYEIPSCSTTISCVLQDIPEHQVSQERVALTHAEII